MGRISDLPSDINITGDELIPAVESGSNVKIPVSSLVSHISNHVTTNVQVGNVPLASGQTFEAEGDIKQGQGVSIFRDQSNNIKMKASDNSTLALSLGASSSFAENVDDFQVDFSTLTTDVKWSPQAINETEPDPSDANANFVSKINNSSNPNIIGFNVKLAVKSGGGWEWNPEANSNTGEAFRVQDGQGNSVEVYRVDLTASGGVTAYVRNWTGSRQFVWYSYIGSKDFTTNYFSTGSDFNNTNITGSLGSSDLTNFQASGNDLTLSFIWSNSDSSYQTNTQYNFSYNQPVVLTGEADYTFLSTELEQTSGRHGVTLTAVSGSSVRFEYNPTTKPKFGAYESNFTQTFDLDRIELNTDNNTILFTNSNRSTSFPLIWRVYAGGNLVFTSSQFTLNSGVARSYNLTSSQKDAIVNASHAIEFEFVSRNSNLTSNWPDSLLVFKQVGTSNSGDQGFTEPADYTFKGIPLTDTRTSNVSFSAPLTFKVTDTKLLTRCFVYPWFVSRPKITKNSSNEAVFGAVENYLLKVNSNDNPFNQGADSVNGTQCYCLFEKESGTWTLKATFIPSYNRATDGATGNKAFVWRSSESNSVPFTFHDDSSELIVALGRQNLTSELPFDFGRIRNFSTEFSGSANYWNRREAGYQNSNDSASSVLFFKLDKTNNTFQYVINRTTTGTQNWFDNFVDASYTSSYFNPYVIKLINGFQNNTGKVAYIRYRNCHVATITKSTYNTDYEQYAISINASVDDHDFGNSTTAHNQFTHYDGTHHILYFTWRQSSNFYLQRVHLNSGLTDFLRDYNSSTQQYDSQGIQSQSISFTNPLFFVNPFPLIETTGFITEDFIIEASSSGSNITGRTYQLRKGGAFGFFGRQAPNETGTKTQLTGTNSGLSFNSGFYNLFNVVQRASSTTMQFKRLSATEDGAGYTYNFSPNTAVGVALEAVDDGDDGTMAYLSGSNVITLSGATLITGADYFLNITTGELTNQGGRRIGRAISATQILVEA